MDQRSGHLFRAEGVHRRDGRRARGRDDRGAERARGERHGSHTERHRIPTFHAVQLGREQAARADRQRNPKYEADDNVAERAAI